MADGDELARRSARVLLLDENDRLLLLGFAFAPEHVAQFGVRGWCPPGGGVEEGESLAEAAARELREEVGLTVAADELGDVVAYTGGFADLGFARGLFRDDFFALRVDAFEPDVGGMLDREGAAHLGHRWWTVIELRSWTETILPYGLADLVTELTAGRRRARPVALPWHH